MVQIDHMTVCRDGRTLKEFRAACPTGKFMTARMYSRATAGHAKRFLEAVIEDLPYPLQSIPVDGGSEFRAGFEDACESRVREAQAALAGYQHLCNCTRPQLRPASFTQISS